MNKRNEWFGDRMPESMRGGESSGTGRPAGARPVYYTQAWFHFLMVVFLLIAWFVPMKIWLGRIIWPPVKRGPADAYAFMALAYEGVSAKTNEISPRRFREQINALKKNGYVPITLREARDLYKEGRPLPRKAVLVTFDHSRKSSYYSVKSILQRAGWNAVMFLWTRPIDEEEPAALLWPYVRDLAQSPAWEIGAQSFDGFTPIPTDPLGGMGHYMTSREWLDAEKRYETYEEFARRLDADHVKCMSEIEKRTGKRPIAYAYPYGDFGQFRRRDQQIKKINQHLVARHYDLGFLIGNFACNTRYTDPRRLTRLRVNPAWSGQDLVDQLDKSWPKNEMTQLTNSTDAAAAWQVDWGYMQVNQRRIVLQSQAKTQIPAPEEAENAVEGLEVAEDDWLVLFAPETITGARMWLASSSLRQDCYWRIVFRLVDGQMGVFLRSSPDEEQFVYLGVDTGGGVWLRQKYAGLMPFTLASAKVRIVPHQDHVLEVYLRGNLMGALLDGKSLFDERIELRGDPTPGMMGLSVWDTQKGKARLEVADVMVSDQEPTLAYWEKSASEEPFYTQWVHRNGFRLTHLSPAWMEVSAGGHLSQIASDWLIPRTLTQIYRLDFMPRIEVRDAKWDSVLVPRQLLASALDIKSDGLLVDFSRMSNLSLDALAVWAQQIVKEFKQHGLSILVRLPRVVENAAALQSVLAMVPQLPIAVASDSEITGSLPGATEMPVRTERIPDAPDPTQIPQIYELSMSGIGPAELTVQEQVRNLQQEGKVALNAGRHQKAIDAWTQWHKLAPNDPMPLMLIGDVYVRMGQLEQGLRYYEDSLLLDPGRISLAMRRANLLDQMGRLEESAQLINLYSRLFPDNAEILIAQATWLDAHGQRTKANELIDRALALKPDNIDVIVMAVRLAATPEERLKHLSQLQAFRDRPELHTELGDAIQRYDLLGMPGAYVLVPMIDEICNTTSNEQVAALFGRFKRLPEPIRETFAMGRLSDSWNVGGGHALPDNRGNFRIQVDESHRELFVKLKGAELTRNGFIEAGLVGNVGEFWLVAKRGWKQHVRFGFDKSSMLFLQVWSDGQMISNQKRFWNKTGQICRMRLEVRGYGAMGYIDGKPVFDTPVSIPRDLWCGSWGVSVFSSEAGEAMAHLEDITVGPLPLTIALLPPPPRTMDETRLLDMLQPLVGAVSALSPRWFFWQPNGRLERVISPQDEVINILARFHGIELMPAIEMSEQVRIQAEDLISKAREYRLDGFLLVFSAWPSEEWLMDLARVLEQTSLDILAVVPDEKTGQAQVRGMGAIVGFFEDKGPFHIMKWASWPDPDLNREALREWPDNTILQIRGETMESDKERAASP